MVTKPFNPVTEGKLLLLLFLLLLTKPRNVSVEIKTLTSGLSKQEALHISEAHLSLEDFRSSQRSLCRASPSYLHPSPPCQLCPSSPTEVTELTPHDAPLLSRASCPLLCRGDPPAVVCRCPASLNLFILALHHLCRRVPGLFMWRRFTAAAALFLLWRVSVSSRTVHLSM